MARQKPGLGWTSRPRFLPRWLTPDAGLILAARSVRAFAYGSLTVLLGIYLHGVGFTPTQIGVVLAASLAGSAGLTLLYSVAADRLGRRRMLAFSALLLVVTGVTFALTASFPILLLAAATGSVATRTGEVGPFLPLEQAILPQVTPSSRRNQVFGLYNMVGALAGSGGALVSGLPALLSAAFALELSDVQRAMFFGYAALGAVTLGLFLLLSPAVEAPAAGSPPRLFTLTHSRGTVTKLSFLFGLDAFAGGFVLESLVVFWFHLRFGVGTEVLGPVFFAGGLIQAGSYWLATRLADRIGLINTMVFTHLPSNVLLASLPLAPNLGWAIGLLFARFLLSQMDVPTRQAYTMAVVHPEERTAAAGITHLARPLALVLSPPISGYAMQVASLGLPFFLGGGLKIVYDLILYASFRGLKPLEEKEGAP